MKQFLDSHDSFSINTSIFITGTGILALIIYFCCFCLLLTAYMTSLRVHLLSFLAAFIPLCENMPSGSAVKPGDVVTAMNGKTIQVSLSVCLSVCLSLSLSLSLSRDTNFRGKLIMLVIIRGDF